jgi:hypothetical protein
MKLTCKDKDFLERLKALLEEKELAIDLREDGVKRLVLRQNYGDRVEKTFNMSRQGARWRFYRLFNEVYVSAYETIYFVESFFGTELRNMAMEIAKERVELRKKAQKIEFSDASRREDAPSELTRPPGQLTRDLPS